MSKKYLRFLHACIILTRSLLWLLLLFLSIFLLHLADCNILSLSSSIKYMIPKYRMCVCFFSCLVFFKYVEPVVYCLSLILDHDFSHIFSAPFCHHFPLGIPNTSISHCCTLYRIALDVLFNFCSLFVLDSSRNDYQCLQVLLQALYLQVCIPRIIPSSCCGLEVVTCF